MNTKETRRLIDHALSDVEKARVLEKADFPTRLTHIESQLASTAHMLRAARRWAAERDGDNSYLPAEDFPK